LALWWGLLVVQNEAALTDARVAILKRHSMIAFDLQCTQGHKFEGWFDSVQDFEDQKNQGIVMCPMCGDTEIRRLFSPFTIKSAQRGSDQPAGESAEVDPAKVMRAFYRHVLNEFEDVGASFAKEALKIHYGVSEKKKIRGITTADEEQTLKDEGVEYMKVPVPRSDA